MLRSLKLFIAALDMLCGRCNVAAASVQCNDCAKDFGSAGASFTVSHAIPTGSSESRTKPLGQ